MNRKNSSLLESLEHRVLMSVVMGPVGGSSASLSSSTPNLSTVEFRTIDGTENNEENPDQGAARTRQIRFGYGSQFPDGYGDVIMTDAQRANPRTISNAIHAQTESLSNDRLLTDWIFQWGQWITHDMDHTKSGAQYNTMFTGETGNYKIPILDPNDPLGPRPMSFNRSEYDPATGTPEMIPGFDGQLRPNRREVINGVTSYIDASMVYGSDDARALALRTLVGGKLKTSANGQLLPLNTDLLPNADDLGKGGALFLAGDVRANEQLGLTAVHTLFVREHNRLADRIGRLYPKLNDEQIYQLARRIVGAEMQIITYEEYLPALFGEDLAPDPNAATYDPELDASITNSFAHAVFRFGHSQINETTKLVNNLGQQTGELLIRDAFFNPDFLKTNPGNVGRMLKGLGSQLGQENDLALVDGIRNKLFGPPGSGAGGLDLAALDIQRGRDHGLPDYNSLRDAYGLEKVTSFAEISSDPEIQAKLEEIYGNVDNIDAFVGALAEDHLPGSSVGALIHALVGNQFERLRDGDRFFYTNDELLDSRMVERVIDLDSLTLSKVIKMNTGMTNIQDNVFVMDVDITGRLFNDRDGNGKPGWFEAGLSGVKVQLLDDAGTILATTTTGWGGRYRFQQVAPGELTVKPLILSGSQFTTASTVEVDSRTGVDFNNVDFGVKRSRGTSRFEVASVTSDSTLALKDLLA